jgi:hypothetical protein
VAVKEGDTLTAYNPVTKDLSIYVYNGTQWVTETAGGVVAESKAVTDLTVDLEALDTSIYGATGLENTLRGEITDEGARVEGKFEYNSALTIEGVTYNTGFGLTSEYIRNNNGTGSTDSEFWINAEKFKFTNSNNQTVVNPPFSIDASGTSPQITFNGRVSFNSVTSVPDYTLNNNVGASLTPPFTSWNYIDNFTTTADNIKLTANAGYPETEQYYPIDSTKAYKVRFRARPQDGCNGLLYFCLRQYVDKGVVGPGNSGRSPYYPSAVSAAANGSDWKTYEYIWHPNDWQEDCIYVRPNFLNNYSGSTGYWEIQDFYMFEAADVTDYAGIATDAQNKANTAQTNAINTANANIAVLGNATAREYWAACYNSSNPEYITYDSAEAAVKLYSSSDTSIGMCTPAQAKGDSTGFKIAVTFKASSSVTSGVYFRVQEYDGDLSAGKTHISNGSTSSESRVQEDTRQIDSLYENDAASTSWQTKTFTYTPTSTAKYFSFLVLNWTSLGTGALYIRNVDITPQAPDISDQLPKVVNSTSTPTSSNVYPIGTIWRYSHSVTINGTANTEYTHYLSEGGGTWRNIGGTYIDGSKVVTGTLSAINADLGTVTAGLMESADGSFRVDLNNKYIYIA